MCMPLEAATPAVALLGAPCSPCVVLRAHYLCYSVLTLCGTLFSPCVVLRSILCGATPSVVLRSLHTVLHAHLSGIPFLPCGTHPCVVLRAHPCSMPRAASVERFDVFLVTLTALPDLPMPLGYHAGLRAYPTIGTPCLFTVV